MLSFFLESCYFTCESARTVLCLLLIWFWGFLIALSSEGGHGNPLWYYCLKKPMNRGAWWATVYRVTESDMTEATRHPAKRQSRRMCSHLLRRELQNYNLLLNNQQQENVGSHQKKIPHIPGQRRSPRKTVGGAKSHLESNPLPASDAQKAQIKPCAHQKTPQK